MTSLFGVGTPCTYCEKKSVTVITSFAGSSVPLCSKHARENGL